MVVKIKRLSGAGVVLMLHLVTGLLVYSQDIPRAVDTAIDARQLTTQVDALVSREMQERHIPGLQLAVVQHGKLVLLRAYGLANLQDSIPVTNQSVFSINSCTKAFTGVAIMQLVEAGKVDLSAPVSRYLDGLPADWQPVTVRQLLTHVSGLPNINRVLYPTTAGFLGVKTEDAAWTSIQTLPMDFVTGTQFSYNQTNYVLLGKIIDKLTGKPFAQLFAERQFQVARMASTDWGDSREIVAHKAQSYGLTKNVDGHPLLEVKVTNVFEAFMPFYRTGAGLNSTAQDIARWLIALQQDKLLHTKTALTTLWTAGSYNNGSPTQWALGWVTKPRPAHRAVMATGGSRSALFVYPDDALAIVVLTNLAGASPEEFIDELAGLYNPALAAVDAITTLRMQLRTRGFAHTTEVAREEKKKNPAFHLPEEDVNDWAYRLMSRGQLTEATELFKLNVSLYPASWNAYDSYGEALLKSGQRDQAIDMYQKSLGLNPANQGAKKVLDQLSK